MKRLRYSIFLILSVIMGLASCKKSKKLIPDKIPDPKPTETGKFIPIKFEASDFTLNLKYKENTSLLTEITDSEANKTIITYTKELDLYKLEKYNNDRLFYIVYYQQVDQNPTSKALIFDYDDLLNRYNPRGFYSISYNEQQKIAAINYYNNSNGLIAANVMSYGASKNLSAMNITDYPGSTTTTKYTFDQKQGICSNVTNSELLAPELEYWFFLGASNNILSTMDQQSPKENTSFNYEYNENGYPSTVKITSDEATKNINITYKRLDP
jgi:hypothetical protein